MGKSITGALQMSDQKILKGSHSVISSPESVDGREHYSSQDGVQTDLFGLEVPHASHSQQQEKGKEKTMSDTSGLSSSISSESASLQQSLVSKLQQLSDSDGSMIYKLTLKEKVTPAQRSYYHLAASAHRTKEIDSSSWLTPTTSDTNGVRKPDGKRGLGLNTQAHSAWPTPAARDVAGKSGAGRQKRKGNPSDTVPNAAATVPWATPNTMDHMKQRSDEALARAKQKAGCSNLKDQIPYSGEAQKSSTAETENIAPSQLNPRFSLWLMGYPIEWAYCAERVTPSSRKRQRKS
jgi:hypothetical protein